MSLLHFSQFDTTYTTTTTTSEVSPELASGIFGAFLIFFVILWVLWVIPALITLWKLFTKANQPGWAAIVPLYNIYVLGQIAGKPQLALIYLGLLLVSAIPFIGVLASIAGLVVVVMLYIEFIKKYQGSVGFWVCYFLLPIAAVFMVKNVGFKGGQAMPGNPMMQGAAMAAPMQGTYPAQPMQQPVQPVYGQAMQQAPEAPVAMQPQQPIAPPQAAYPQPMPQQPVDQPMQQPPVGPMPPQPPVA